MAHRDVFISYSRPDAEAARLLVSQLEAHGIECWYAGRDVPAGTDWPVEIVHAIGGARVMVLIFSISANNSPQVRREVILAMERGVRVVAFRIEDVAPSESLEYFLIGQQWIDAFPAPLEPHCTRLIACLDRIPSRTRISSQNIHTPNPELALPQVPHELLGVIEIPTAIGVARIELHRGDLTATSPDDAVDVLVVSAFPDEYYPIESSLIGALELKGISVEVLAHHKYSDLRQAFSCWLSTEIAPGRAGINFGRILCFEPLYKKGIKAPEAIGDIFRALAPFIGADPHVTSVAMPLLATGNQMHTVSEILPPLLYSAAEWLKIGLPLRTVKIYTMGRQASAAQHILETMAADLRRRSELKAAAPTYDALISYAHSDREAALAITSHLQSAGLRVFVDELQLDTGVAWQQEIFRVLDQARAIIAVYSPDYVRSKVCQEEFNIAWARKRKDDAMFVYPIYWRSSKLPTYMELLNFADCRECQAVKLEQACATLSGKLRGG